MARDMDGRVAIVTGGAGGIGGAAARHLASRGARVLVSDVAEAGQAVADEIGGAFMQHDVSQPGQWDAVAAQAIEWIGRIDILVNAAGIEGNFALAGLTADLDEWRRVMAINLDGTFLGARAVMPAMLSEGTGSIVNLSSIVSFMGTPTALAYGASKAGVEQLTRSLAHLGARDGARVRCNSVHPGVIRTRMTDSIIASFAAAQGTGEAEAEAIVCSAIPFGTRGTVEDIAALIGYLASDAAGYVTGSAFRCDGGWSVISAG